MLLVLGILTSILTACGSGITLAGQNVEDSPVARPTVNYYGKTSYYNGYFYFSVYKKGIMRYSVESGNLTSVCMDPLCFHDTMECPFYMAGTSPEIYGTRLFYEGVDLETRSYPWYVYDVASGNRKMILTDDEVEGFVTLYRDRLYYIGKELREGQSDEKTENYDIVLYYIDTETWKKQRAYVLGTSRDQDVGFIEFLGDRILWTCGTTWYTTDLDCNDWQEFGTFEDIYKFPLCDRENGVLYGSRATDELLGYVRTEFNGQKPVYRDCPVIIRADGSCTELTQCSVASFLEVTENYLYYYKYTEFGEEAEKSIFDGALWRCSHDGSREECVLTAEELGGAQICRIAGGAAYLIENNNMVKLDFATKERTVIWESESNENVAFGRE